MYRKGFSSEIMGKLIVLEGIDGSGKSSQYSRICEKLKADKTEYRHIVFPRYDKESSALIRMYLGGAFGSRPGDVNAYTASTFYAVDRFASYREDWGEYYENGGVILSDRYTTSNAVHQGCKLSDEELPGFFDWLRDLEQTRMCLPEPDLVLYLDTSVEISADRMRLREEKTGTTADIHEQDTEYLVRCLHTADLACEHYGWVRIPYRNPDGSVRELEEKNREIYAKIREFLDI